MIYLLEMTGYDPGTSTVKVWRYCSGLGFTSAPTDTPANTYYEPRLSQPGLFRQDMYTEGATSGKSKGGYGEIVLTNLDGGLDSLLDIGFDGRSIVVKGGEPRAPLAAFATLFTGTCEQLAVSWGKVTVRLRDRSAELNVPLQPLTYAGTNAPPDGVEGGAELKGKRKPLLYGSCLNISPVLVNSERLIYHVTTTGLYALSAVYQGGLAVARGVARGSLKTLEENVPALATFDYVLGDGGNGAFFRLGSNPAGNAITCDAQASGGVSVGQISKALVADKCGVGSIVAQAILDLDLAAPYTVGYYSGTNEVTVAAVLDTLCASAGAWWGFDNLGRWWCKQLQAPQAAQSCLTLTPAEVLSVDRIATTDGDRGVPPYRVNLGYAKNWTVQNSGLAGAVGTADVLITEAAQTPLTVDRATRLAMEYYHVQATDAAVQTAHTLAPEVTITTLLQNQTDAWDEANRILNLRKVRRDRLKVRCSLSALYGAYGGSWDDEAVTEMPLPMQIPSLASYSEYVYLVGGPTPDSPGQTYGTAIHRLNMNAPSTAWELNVATPLPEARGYCSTVVYNGYLYVIGGLNNANNDVFSVIRLNLANPYGPWDTTGVTSLPIPVVYGQAGVYNNYLYVIGESGAISRLNLAAPTGAWSSTGIIPCPLAYPQATLFSGKYLYALQGLDPNTYAPLVTAYRLPLDSLSSPWVQLPDLPQRLGSRPALAASATWLYLCSGEKAYRLDMAKFRQWDNAGIADFPGIRISMSGFTFADDLYLFGGWDSSALKLYGNTIVWQSPTSPKGLTRLTDLGRTLTVRMPRYGYTDGRPMRIIGSEVNYADNKITLDLWG